MGYGRNGVHDGVGLWRGRCARQTYSAAGFPERLGPARAMMLVIGRWPFFSRYSPRCRCPCCIARGHISSGDYRLHHAAQQSASVSLDPERQNVSLSLNASAIYVGAAIGSPPAARSIDRQASRRSGGHPHRDAGPCSGISSSRSGSCGGEEGCGRVRSSRIVQEQSRRSAISLTGGENG